MELHSTAGWSKSFDSTLPLSADHRRRSRKRILTSTLAPRFARPPHCTLRPSTRTRRAQDRTYPARFPAPSPPLSHPPPPSPLAARSWAPTMTTGTTRPRILCRRRPGGKPALTVSPHLFPWGPHAQRKTGVTAWRARRKWRTTTRPDVAGSRPRRS